MTQQANASLPDLWGQRVDLLGLKLETSPLWPQVETLYKELSQAGIGFRPPLYVANEWGCPDGVPIIGVPFYLVDSRFWALEEQHADDLEDSDRILMGLRHEAGHAVNYAYRLYEEAEWTRLFGNFFAEYDDDYLPCPFSRKHVRHLPGWYAQKHPDEDFAETFAVWLTPGLDWKARYSGTEALPKLEYIDRLAPRIGHLSPSVDPSSVTTDPDELAFTVAEFYKRRAEADGPPVDELRDSLDQDLRELFPAEGLGIDGATVTWERRRSIMRTVSNYTGSRMYVVKALLEFLIGRLRVLGVRAVPGKESDSIIGLTALITMLTSNFLRTRHFVDPAPDAAPRPRPLVGTCP
ncbi:MAG: putative zinc-binding metallopeptidase [Deltaproteobacteria bacterium]|nr:putative zinc-binding metallopeptidase [Deltaproteobacteria bacterium]